MQKMFPCLWFNDQAEQAAHFYTTAFTNGKIDTITTYGDDMAGPKGKVITVTFLLNGQVFMALNGGPEFSFTPAVSFFVYCQTPEEVQALWDRRSEDGTVLVELDQYPFSEKFGWIMDPFGERTTLVCIYQASR
jgi:predicted 3-demethylubiquinone-9 3-methyltransferase (glyoxalase superfamily)